MQFVKTVIDDPKKFFEGIEKDSVIVLTSAERKKTTFYQKFIDDCKNFEINTEPNIDLLDDIFDKIKNKPEKIIAYGGGSAIDSAKILSVAISNNIEPSEIVTNFLADRKNVGLAFIPTTYSGSEANNIAVYINQEKKKKSLKNDNFYADAVVNSKEKKINNQKNKIMLADMFFHALESFYSVRANKLAKFQSVESIRLLERFIKDGRDDLFYASILAGSADGVSGVSFIHALAYPLQNIYHINHSSAICIIFKKLKSDLDTLFGDKNFKQFREFGISNAILKNIFEYFSSIKITVKEKIDASLCILDLNNYKYLLNNNPKGLGVDKITQVYKNK